MASMEKKEPGSSVQNAPPPPLYCILSEKEKIFTIVMVSLVVFLGPASGDIYYPALGSVARDLNVSESKINFTITSYMIVQALAPLLTSSVSDQKGRRPVLLLCLTIYLAANIGLALQNNFAALITLRCFQSLGSSGALVVSLATVSDLVTRAERGKYMAYSSLGFTLGPAIGPILGGVMLFIILCFLRETCRAVVGNGSLRPQSWNKPLILELFYLRSFENPDYETRLVLRTESENHGIFSKILLGILGSLKVVLNKPINLLVLSSTAIYCGFIAVMVSIPALLQRKYHFNSLHIGLYYLPFAVGGFAARWTIGSLADWNFRRHSRQVGIEVQRNQQTREQLLQTPLEKVRLQLVLPLVYLSCPIVLGYSWAMNYDVHISCLLVMLFLLGNSIVGMNNMLNTFLVDLHASRPATALAGMNMYKFLVGAGAVAAVLPLIDVIGIGWVGTIVAGMWFLASPGLWMIYVHGHAWRMKSQSEQASECLVDPPPPC